MSRLRLYLLLFPVLQFCVVIAQNKQPFISPVPVVKRMIELNHCSPREINEGLSADILNTFINKLDKEHLYFTSADVKQLTDDRQKMNEELAGKSHVFINSVLSLYQSRMKKADSAINSILQKPFEFSAAEEISFANDSSDYAADEKDYRNRWVKWLKYKTLYRLTHLMSSDSTLTAAAAMKQEPAQREIVRKTELRKIKKITEHPWGYPVYVSSLFCNAVAAAYDPHTEFFPLAAKENFLGAVNGEAFSFGLQLNENDKDEIEIMRIVPGSPAWKSGELNKSDVLLQMQWEGKSLIDLTGASMEEVNNMFSDLNHNRVTLVVRKTNGQQKTVALLKMKMREDENFVKSFILKCEKKIGYILLPGFYSQWETVSGSSCANDVAKEIMKLKKEHIEGLILDLRNNGGGSMEEAMQLSGIFIDEGTLGFEKGKTGKPFSLKDPNRGTIYDDPLVVMVNGGSASASEFVAGALQDYNRAIITGSPTYGKATAQSVLPADTNFNPLTGDFKALENTKSDFVKVTVGKLYRVSGKSNQLNGVEPDVLLPDVADDIPYRERYVKYALPSDTTKRAAYFNPLPRLPLYALNEKSFARVSANSKFKLISKSKSLVNEMYSIYSQPVSLQWDAYLKRKNKYTDEWKKFDELMDADSVALLKVENHSDDKAQLAVDSYRNEINTNSLKYLSQDPYIYESFLILADYIHTFK